MDKNFSTFLSKPLEIERLYVFLIGSKGARPDTSNEFLGSFFNKSPVLRIFYSIYSIIDMLQAIQLKEGYLKMR